MRLCVRNKQSRFSRTSISYSTTAATLSVLTWLLLNLQPAREPSGQGTVMLANRIAVVGTNPGLTAHIWGPSPTNPDLTLFGFGFVAA
jgi:hypothetical protein